jgi:hypothetical protein
MLSCAPSGSHALMRSMWADLLELARWAPSPHNIQPWRVRIRSDDEAELLYEPARLLPATDPTGRFSVVGLGVFVETLAVAARDRGLDVVVRVGTQRLEPGTGPPAPWAHLRLVPFSGDDLGAGLILARRTSRLPYDGRAVPQHVADEVASTARGFGYAFQTSVEPELVDWVLALNCDTLFEDLTVARARAEVGGWLRFSEREAAARRDGFAPSALGFPGWLLKTYFRLAPILELPGPRHAIRALYSRTMRGTRTIGWFTGPFERPGDWLGAGRMLGRVWLVLTAHGVVFHPFGSIITNERANARLQERIGADRPGATTWLIARLGYSAEPPRSHRRTVEELLA